MNGIDYLDLTTQRVLSLHVRTLEDRLQTSQTALEVALKRIAELEAADATPEVERDDS